jgi:hypothetical protein
MAETLALFEVLLGDAPPLRRAVLAGDVAPPALILENLQPLPVSLGLVVVHSHGLFHVTHDAALREPRVEPAGNDARDGAQITAGSEDAAHHLAPLAAAMAARAVSSLRPAGADTSVRFAHRATP